ncbi:MAG: ABC transporter ATP-binding protein [Anaerolinea sp.]|nr:ABC transporter ATP-binding protein [Anaerolinea sp.]
MEKPLLHLVNLHKAYYTPAGEFWALRGISLTLQAGCLVGIFGKSGAGKTTLINCISGVDRVSAGEVWVDGVAVHSLGESALARWRGLSVGVVYQNFQLLPHLTLLENVMLPMDFCGRFHPRRSPQRALELLRMVEMEEHAHKLPAAISGGQQQRAAIARALANDPPLILADEPTGRLDSVTAETVIQAFERLVQQGKTIVMVTHDRSLAPRCGQVLTIVDGQLVEKQ